jgi:hypothetical protein
MSRAILKTLAYSDIFDYPLTAPEVAKYLISDTEVTVDTIQDNLLILTDSKRIYTDGEFYFLKKREKIVEIRKEREKWSRQKLIIAQRTAEKLKTISSIKMIGITGALAMDNCQEDDDIDLLIVTSANSLWLTRLLIIFFSPFLGIKRRKSKEKTVKNKICFNLFLDENYLKIQPESLFLAHEICQVKPIIYKDITYNRFIKENEWVLKFLPNFSLPLAGQNSKFKTSRLLSFLNKIAFSLQYQYMRKKITNEKVSLSQAFFHPKDLSDQVQKEFESRLFLL